MKKLNLLLFFWCFCLLGMVAAPIDETQALSSAQAFLKEKRTASGARRYAPGRLPQLKLAGQVNGLYVYNVSDDGGFVIVSNDDATIPVLGFSEGGSIDIDRIPSNMKAWLKGYADEIAWYQKHGVKLAQYPRRTKIGNHPTDPVLPLLKTTWSQDEPYNNMCPLYNGYSRAVTGCVATAMAQVMKFHEWPQSETKPIKGYISISESINLKEGLPATTFDWANMLDSYDEGYSPTEAKAVARLMQYCGYSVEMDYSFESGALSELLADALKNYFDYSETTQYVMRAYYSTAKWNDLIYHEVANGRPVLYGGSTTSYGGHQFVCDGYKYENETDFFHINWGWGGMSDDYFVLSALDPYQQGIGGSMSGFNLNQDAVIGIQPSTGTGTIADIHPNVRLKVNSITPEQNPAYAYMTVNVIVNVTNDSDKDYDGDFYVGWQIIEDEDTTYSLDYNQILEHKDYHVAAGETKDLVIPIMPGADDTYTLVCIQPCINEEEDDDNLTTAELKIEKPSLNETVPIYSGYYNNLSASQFIIPATDLQDKLYANLNGMTLYYALTSIDPFNWGSADFEVYLGEVSESTITDGTLKDWNSLDRIYTGHLLASMGQMKITFDAPFQYMGGNLLVGIKQKTAGDYFDFYWLGTFAPGASLGGSPDTPVPVHQQNFLPFTAFDYTPGTAPEVAKPLALSVNYTGGTTAEVKWTSTESAWDIEVNGTVKENITNPYTLTGLEPATVYTVRVRAKNGSGESEWSAPYTFNTELADDWCQVRFDISCNNYGGWEGAAIEVVDHLTGVVLGRVFNTVLTDYYVVETFTVDVPVGRDIDFVWVKGGQDSQCVYTVYDSNGDVILCGTGAMSHPLTWHVGWGTSFWHRPSDLAVSNIGPHSAELSWKENGEATAWMVAYKTADDADFTEVSADTNPFFLTGLDAKTEYFVKVRPATDEATKWSSEFAFTTGTAHALPAPLTCVPGTTTADLTWADFTDNYDVRYGLVPDNSTWLQYDNDTYRSNWGNNTSRTLTWGVMYPNSMVEDKRLTKVSWFEVSKYYDSDITVKIYTGYNSPVTLLSSLKVAPQINGGFHEVNLPIPVQVESQQNLWIMLTAKGTKVISYCKSDEPNNQWILRDGSYCHLSDLDPNYAGSGFMIRGLVEDAIIDESNIEWTTTTSSEPSFQMTGLTPETNYVAQVRSDYGEDGVSRWLTTTFTTHSLCDVPNTLVTSDITSNTATVTWTGYQDSYDLEFKVKQTPDEVQDFDDSSFGHWTTIDADGDGFNWLIFSQDTQYHIGGSPGDDIGLGMGHNGSADKAISGSHSNLYMFNSIYPDNYLVSPQVKLGGTISFWVYGESDLFFHEHFGVAVSTTGNVDAADFTTIQEWTLDEGMVWKQYIADLSAYEGQEGYVAIRHFASHDEHTINIDDIVIKQPDDGTPWTTVNNISTNSYHLTGLAPQTDYWVRVRGTNSPCGNTSWCQTIDFSTLEGGATGIRTTDFTDTQNSKLTSGWFSIDGRRLNSRPTKKGVYIHNGRKVVK